ncbi:protein of unknown function [Candidatus Filomicrobium marinum]|uniref:Uncharacterized protein n=2 Tax=Candidatus Filomicrobium marinum TaxID=1608628 RepID=A0A0D6JAX8_9HYPH|nr:hypothetical protein [Candidatus Filomicrobium marinum]CPR16046.1 protein of unknown function [Candidatus Filomicrobium marinum]
MPTTPPVKRKRYMISMLDMSTYRQSFIAESHEHALALADVDQERHGLDNWSEVSSSTEFEVIGEEPISGISNRQSPPNGGHNDA